MDCQISPTVLKSSFEFLYKQTLSTDFREGFIQYLVAPGGHAQDLNIALWIELFEAISDMFRLPHGKTALAGGDYQALRGGGDSGCGTSNRGLGHSI
jgi:hypothetical protein